MSKLAILDFSFPDSETRTKDFAFLQKVFHLKVQYENEVYTALADENAVTIGLMNTSKLEEAAQEGYKAKVVPNFSVKADDFDTTIETAVQNGGKVLMPKTTIEGTGYFAIVQTPSGVSLALVQEKE